MDIWEAAKFGWTVLAAIGGVAWKVIDNRITKLEANSVTQLERKERGEVVDAALEARRQDVIAIHAKIDGNRERAEDAITQLSRDMHAGFGEIKTILLERR